MPSRHGKGFAAITLTLSIVTALAGAPPAAVAEEGRYQAIVLHEGGVSGKASGSFSPKVFIIDTREGHMWTWEENARLKGERSAFGTKLTYQGKVRPGKQMGSVVQQSRR